MKNLSVLTLSAVLLAGGLFSPASACGGLFARLKANRPVNASCGTANAIQSFGSCSAPASGGIVASGKGVVVNGPVASSHVAYSHAVHSPVVSSHAVAPVAYTTTSGNCPNGQCPNVRPASRR